MQIIDDVRRNGHWWLSKDWPAKRDYVCAFCEGIHLGHCFSLWGLPGTPEHNPVFQEIIDSYTSHLRRFAPDVTFGQIVQGLDEFYANFKNGRIKVQDAVWVVMNEIVGRPKTDTDAAIEALRREAAENA